MSTGRRHRTSPRALLGPAFGALLLTLWLITGPTFSAWSTATTLNAANNVASGQLAVSHSTGSPACTLGPRAVTASIACSGAVTPTDPTTAGAAVNGTDTTTTTSASVPGNQLVQSVAATSCATVALTNRTRTANPLLPRYTTDSQATDPFGGTNAIALGGTSYAAAVSTYNKTSTNNTSQAMGVWFKATSGQSGPLFSTGSNPDNTAGTDDRILFLAADGKIKFIQNTTGNATAITSTGQSYADGTWYFAYVILADNGTQNTVSLSINANAATGNGATTTAYDTGAGYVHLGWAPTARTGLTNAYFPGSVSNLVQFNGTSVPARPTTLQLASQAAFTTWASNGATAGSTDHWLLGDSATTTYTGAQPTIGTTSPCSMLDVTWSFTNPAATAVSGVALATLVTNGAASFSPGPAPGTGQVGTFALRRGATYNTYIAGLRLYVPTSHRISAGTGWALTFTWTGDAAVVIA